VYDNIGGTGAAFWANLVAAVNSGQTGQRGATQLVVATQGSSTATPNITAIYAFSGGEDGASGVTDATLVGSDGLMPSQRTGVYALRSSGAQVLNLIDLVSSAQWPTVVIANSEGMYAQTQVTMGATYSTIRMRLGRLSLGPSWQIAEAGSRAARCS